jgi:hypothetical protein
MASSSLRNEILHQFEKLKPDQQRKVLEFARALANTNLEGTRGKDLLRFAGTIEPSDLKEMTEAIEQDCEKVDANEW